MGKPILHYGLYVFASALAIAAQPVGVYAQSGGRPPGGAGAGGARGMGGAPPCKAERLSEAGPEAQTEHISKQLEALRQQIMFAPGASQHFDDFAAKLHAFIVDEAKRRSAPRTLSISTLGRIGAVLDDSRNQYAALEDVYASAKRLHDTLDDSGRKALDQLALPIDMPGRRP